MSVSFDWDFQETEKSFSEEPGGSSVPPGWRSRLRRVVIVLVVLLALGLVVRAWANQRLETIHEAEDKLRDLVQQELNTIRQGDAELFGLIQDPAIPRWQKQQVARYIPSVNWTFVPSARGFAPAPGLVPVDRDPLIGQVRVVGRNARVELTYWLQLPPGVSQPQVPESASALFASLFPQAVTWPFQVTWFYRLEQDGAWYHTAPPDDYEGAPYSWYGPRLDVHASEAEAQVLNEAVGDMTLLMYQGCALLDCPEDVHYSLYFDDAPGPLVSGYRWTLPSLYLTGQPGDARARAVWLHAVKLWMVENLVWTQLGGAFMGGGPLTNSLLFRQLVARTQAELGLIEPPSPDVEILRQALLQGQTHPLWRLWQAAYDPRDPQATRLLQAEVAALLQFIEARVGAARFFELLPAMNDYEQLGDVLMFIYGLDRDEFIVDWYAHLSSLGGVALASTFAPSFQVELPSSHTGLPMAFFQPAVSLGNQIALNCDGQIMAVNLDGSDVVPLTPSAYRFSDPLWSPDGRWLLSAWLREDGETDVMYRLAADGSQTQFLWDNSRLRPLGWSHDGRRVYYYQSEPEGEQTEQGHWTMDVETRQRLFLPVWEPLLSPDGRRVVFFSLPYQGVADPLWLADVSAPAAWGEEWENVRQLGRGAGTNVMDVSWSPDSARLALVLRAGHAHSAEYGISIYDLATERLTPLVSLADLEDAIRSSEGDLLTGDVDSTGLEVNLLPSLNTSGWSADGRHLLVQAARALAAQPENVSLLVPVDGSLPRVLAFNGDAAWSPTDPHRLAFIQYLSGSDESQGYLMDLEGEPISTTTHVSRAVWSPDGEWLAFDGMNQLTVVDREGRTSFVLGHNCGFVNPAWNPAADLALPAAQCGAGLDLWIDEQDVRRVGNTIVVVVHNSGRQAAQDVRLRLTVDPAASSETLLPLDRWADPLVVPPCGSLMLRLVVGDDPSGPLTVSVNPPDEPGALPELDHGNNQVTLEKLDF